MHGVTSARWAVGVGAGALALSGCIPDVTPTSAASSGAAAPSTGAAEATGAGGGGSACPSDGAGGQGGVAACVGTGTPRWNVGTLGHYCWTHDLVFDTTTRLTWQRVTLPARRTYLEAGSYCTGLDLQGKGWRLPTRAELLSIVNYSRSSPAIDTEAFPDTMFESDTSHWTSTPQNNNDQCGMCAFAIGFKDGDVWGKPVNQAFYVRCVR